MGMIRKTLSVSTVGLVSFRSKKERLARADRALRKAEHDLDREHTSRLVAETRIGAAEHRLKRATGDAERASKRLARSKKNDRRAGLVRDIVEDMQPVGRKAAKAARRSARDAKVGAKRSLKQAKGAALSAKEALAPPVERAVARASEAIDSLSS